MLQKMAESVIYLDGLMVSEVEGLANLLYEIALDKVNEEKDNIYGKFCESYQSYLNGKFDFSKKYSNQLSHEVSEVKYREILKYMVIVGTSLDGVK